VPCLSNGFNPPTFLPAATCAGILQNVLTLNPASSPLKAFAVNQIESNGGLLPFPISSHQGPYGLDHLFNDTNQGSLRYIAAHLERPIPPGMPWLAFSTGYAEHQWTSSLQVSWLHTFNVNMFNEVRAQWNINQYNLFLTTRAGRPLPLARSHHRAQRNSASTSRSVTMSLPTI